MTNYALFFAHSGAVDSTAEHCAAPTIGWIGETAARGFFSASIEVNDTKPPSPLALVVARQNFGEWFDALASQWTRETGHLASISKRQQHKAYRDLIGLGQRSVPLLLERLTSNPDLWFPVLRDITGTDPVPPEDRGYYDRMSAAWINWGHDHGLIS